MCGVSLSACVTFGGERDIESSRTLVELHGARYRVVKTALRGEASCPTILYINLDLSVWLAPIPQLQSVSLPSFGIGLGDPALRKLAMADLHSKFEMTGPQVLVNVKEEFSTSGFLFFYREVKLTITADVVEFLEDA